MAGDRCLLGIRSTPPESDQKQKSPRTQIRGLLWSCEVQVRTLLEEVWGEVDHTMNYPVPTADEHCREQIRVLARLVGAGTHLADSIMRRYVAAD